MSINNTISKLAGLLGLKDSKETTVSRKKESVAANVRLNEELRENIKAEMSDIDGQLRMRKEEYQNSSPGNQLVVKSQIMSLKKDRDYIVHKLEAIAARVDAGRLLLHKYDILLFAIRNPAAIDEMDDVREELEVWSKDLAHEEKASQRLATAGVRAAAAEPTAETIDDDGDFGLATRKEDPEFQEFLESIK